jgi:protein-S-isoprenylcysteine O-methyltransferase Ste14
MLWPPPPAALLAYFLVYFLLAFIWRSLLVYRRTGVNPFVLPASDDAHGYVGRAFKLVIIGCTLVVAIIALAPDASHWLGGWSLLHTPALVSAGWLLLLISLAWLLVAQAQMGSSWRIGIDAGHVTALVERGLFRVSRNPIFLAMRVNLLGLFCVYPAAATLAVLVAGEILMQVQTRLEERHLASLHGVSYAAYCARVRRWL